MIHKADDERKTFSFRIKYNNDQRESIAFHSHPLYEIYYFHGGKCSYLIGDKIYVLQPGDLILLHGMTLHSANVDPAHAYVRSVIHFDPSYMQRTLNFPHALDVMKPFRELKNARFSLKLDQQKEMCDLLAKMSGLSLRDDPVSKQRLHIVFCELLTFIYEVYENMIKDPLLHAAPDKVSIVQKVITYVEQHYMADIHLDHLEQHLHINKHYLAKMFKEVTGSTIFTYLYQRRINESRILLYTDKKARITDVCYQVGFKHPAHFSRVFKQHVGCTPEYFRKSSIL